MVDVLIAWLLIGFIVAWNYLGNDKDLSRKDWLIAFLILSCSWPTPILITVHNSFKKNS